MDRKDGFRVVENEEPLDHLQILLNTIASLRKLNNELKEETNELVEVCLTDIINETPWHKSEAFRLAQSWRARHIQPWK